MKRYIVYIIILAIAEIALSLYLAFWRELFWNYVAQKNLHGFCVQIAIFTAIACILCVISAYGSYYTTICAIKWRKYLNLRACNVVTDAENVNQRIQEDCREYPNLLLTLVVGVGKAIAYVIAFAIALIYSYNPVYLVIIVVYSILSSLIAKYIANPLIRLNYINQQAEATYRNDLTKSNFQHCIEIMFGLAIYTKRLSYFQTLYGQIAVILPIIIVAPAYFSSALTLGALMQVTGMMGTISDNLSFGINSFPQINKLMSCHKRLHEIGIFDK